MMRIGRTKTAATHFLTIVKDDTKTVVVMTERVMFVGIKFDNDASEDEARLTPVF